MKMPVWPSTTTADAPATSSDDIDVLAPTNAAEHDPLATNGLAALEMLTAANVAEPGTEIWASAAYSPTNAVVDVPPMLLAALALPAPVNIIVLEPAATVLAIATLELGGTDSNE
jgi:hypothetical protein